MVETLEEQLTELNKERNKIFEEIKKRIE